MASGVYLQDNEKDIGVIVPWNNIAFVNVELTDAVPEEEEARPVTAAKARGHSAPVAKGKGVHRRATRSAKGVRLG
jgi:hypothetical protein